MLSPKDKQSWIRLSHILNSETPGYGGNTEFFVKKLKSINKGDSSNSLSIQMSNHVGTHVDAPSHFIEQGLTIEDYDIEEWVFNLPILIDIPRRDSSLIEIKDLDKELKEIKDADLLLIRTGFEKKRKEEDYWKNSPGFSPELAGYLCDKFPSIRAIGFDTISLTSLRHRELGRKAHRKILGAGIRIFEDLLLSVIPTNNQPQLVIALPLLIEKADGAPCTVIARL